MLSTTTERFLDLEKLTIENTKIHTYYVSNPTIINISSIKDDDEAKDIQNIILYKIKKTIMRGCNFNKSFIHPLLHIIADYDNSGLENFLNEKSRSKTPLIRQTAKTALAYLKERKINGQFLYDDVIYLHNLSIAPDRMGTYKTLTMNLKNIKDPENKELVKKFIFHLIFETDLAIGTINNYLMKITKNINCNNKSCRLWTDEDIRACFNNILSEPTKNSTKNHNIKSIKIFFNYLAINHLTLSSSAWLIANEINLKESKRYKKTAPDEFILSQIFNAIKNANYFIKLTFLILYTTGMRVSELQMLKRNCLDIRENGTYIKFYQPKMRKEVSNVIPQALADMIQDYINHDQIESDYLFHNKKGDKYYSGTFKDNMKRFMLKHNIKNPDGTPYIFKSHSYRHLMAVRMHKFKIPYRYIQEQLHHDSPEMTLFYIEHLDKERIQKITDWINNKGESIKPNDIITNIQRAQIETAILPNGLCTRPETLPSCQHCNTCLGCSFFRTSKEFLPSLYYQKDRLTKFITSAKNNGWDKAVANSKNTLNQLIKILQRLEENKIEH